MRTVCLIGALMAIPLVGWGAAGPARAATAPPICPSGYTFSHGDRACIQTQTPTCPGPYVWNATRKMCMSSQHPRQSCPPGYHLVSQGTACAPSTSSGPPTKPPQQGATIPPSCPSGYSWTASTGHCESNTSPLPSCQSGYEYKASRGLCVKSQPPTCPNGFRFDAVHGVCTSGSVAQ